MKYLEISDEELTQNQKIEVCRTLCTNCKEHYRADRKIMVARLTYTTLWWHYPNSSHCGHLNDRRRRI